MTPSVLQREMLGEVIMKLDEGISKLEICQQPILTTTSKSNDKCTEESTSSAPVDMAANGTDTVAETMSCAQELISSLKVTFSNAKTLGESQAFKTVLSSHVMRSCALPKSGPTCTDSDLLLFPCAGPTCSQNKIAAFRLNALMPTELGNAKKNLCYECFIQVKGMITKKRFRIHTSALRTAEKSGIRWTADIEHPPIESIIFNSYRSQLQTATGKEYEYLKRIGAQKFRFSVGI